MKFLVLTACVAVASAQPFFGLTQHPNGAIVPLDEPAVAAARAEHLAAKGALYAAAAPLATAPLAASPLAYAANYGYSGPLNLNTHLVGHPNGAVVPLDEPAVAAARAEHLAAKGAIYAAGAPVYGAAAPLAAAPLVASPLAAVASPLTYAANYGYAGPLNLNTQLIGHPNGAVVPVDEPAVAAARAEHIAAHGAAYAASAPVFAAAPLAAAPLAAAPLAAAPFAAAPLSYAANYGYSGPLNLNTQLIGHPNGAVVPVDEPAVAAARAEHIAAKGAAYAATAPVFAPAPLAAAPLVAAPLSYAGYAGPLAGVPALVAHPNGAVVPVDEPAVAAARAEHLATKGVYGGVYASIANTIAATPAVYAPYAGLVAHPNGAIVPVDEPAVAKARAEHLSLLH